MARSMTGVQVGRVTSAETAAAVSVRAATYGVLYATVLTDFRVGRGYAEVSLSRTDLSAAAGARGRAMSSGMSDRDAWREALAADLDRLVRGLAGTDAR